MTLLCAWNDRRPLWAEGTKLIEEGNRLWKEIAAMPGTGSVRIGVWYSLSEEAAEAAAKVSSGYAIRLEADALWNDAVVEIKGPKTKLIWEFDPLKKANKCTLESGEVFEA